MVTASPSLATKKLGDYLLGEKLGEGSLAETYLAEHHLLHRKCVVKVLWEELARDEKFVQRFEREMARLATLRHPHLLPIHNVSFTEGRYYMVCDLAADNLENCLRQEKISPEEAPRLIQQLAEAIDFLHSNGVVHGALTPRNVLVQEGEEGLRLVIADAGFLPLFGVGRYFDRKIAGGAKRQELYSCIQWMAPEFFVANQEESTQATDVYGFGLLAYLLTKGALPAKIFSEQRGIEFILRCLSEDPNERPERVLNSPPAQQEGGERTPKPLLQASHLARPNLDLSEADRNLRVDTSAKPYQPRRKDLGQVEPLPSEMVIIEGGAYMRGSPDGRRDEMPRHEVQLDSFAIDIHPVTNEQYVRFLTVMGGEKDHHHRDLIRLRESRIKRAAGKLTIESGYAQHPVVGVTWYGAMAYAKWLGKRLPTEAEWEVAATGAGAELPFPTGYTIDKTLANYFSSDTTAIKSYPASTLGLYDMAGNVYEWCYDWYEYNDYERASQEPSNPVGPPQGVYRVLRGGCWKSLEDDLHASRRHRNNPGTANKTYGFRCAADVG